MADHLHQHHWKLIIGRIGLAIVGIAVLAGIGYAIGPYIPAAEKWVEHLGIWGPIIFVCVYVPAVTCFFPSNAMAFAGGTMFGFWTGYLSITVGTILGTLVQFVIGRYIARKKVEAMMAKHPKLAAIDEAVSQQGFKLMFLLRLAPLPFAPLSYGLAVSRVGFWPYLAATVGMFISNIAPVYYGFVANHVMKLAGHQEHHGWLHYAIMGAGVVVAIIVSVYVGHVARHAMARVNPNHPGHEASKTHDREPATPARS